jgi:predicted N-acyltransferase
MGNMAFLNFDDSWKMLPPKKQRHPQERRRVDGISADNFTGDQLNEQLQKALVRSSIQRT